MKKIVIFLSFFISSVIDNTIKAMMPTVPPRITIWIHGTRGSAFLPIHASKRLTQVEQEVALCPRGLNRAADLPASYHQRRIAHILSSIDPEQFPFETFYCFGWSGDLDPMARMSAAQHLSHRLEPVIQDYQLQYGCMPQITLITHSHGGNVALNLVKVSADNLTIDRLILLACPVQEETESYIFHSMFKKIYSLHSHTDMIQILDMQKFHPLLHLDQKIKKIGSLSPVKKALKESLKLPLFSRRHFQPSYKLAQSLIRWEYTQAWREEDIAIFSHFKKFIRSTFGKLKSRRGLLHLEFLLPSFVYQLPTIIKTLDEHKFTKNDIEIRI